MKVSISYPPITNDFGQKAMVSQNRNVQYFKKPTYLLPVIQAQAATKLKNNGFNVIWDDGNADLKDFDEWYSDLIKASPDIIFFEGTTPVMHFLWDLSKKIKKDLKDTILILGGYHAMRQPHESLLQSSFDIILKSTNVDFVLLDLCKELASNGKVLDNLITTGIAYKKFSSIDSIIDKGSFKMIENLDHSELIDRDLINWKNYAYENGNFLQTPGTYSSSVIRDCMFGKCTFCRYNGPDLSFSKMSIKKSVDEYENLINRGVKEIFDDSGVWYRGKDAIDFAKEIIKRGLHKKNCYFGFNTRFEYLEEESIKWLSKANFRFILIGLESGSNYTLEKLNKGYSMFEIRKNLELMTKYGLHPHLTIMVGYYWETKEMLDETVRTVKDIMYKGLARTLQVTICTPVDYTPYHIDCIENKRLLVDHYNDFDMSKVIVKTPIDHSFYYDAIKEIYSIAFHPRFIFRQLLFLFKFRKRDWQFLFTYSIRAIRRVNQHIFNLTHKNN